MVHIYSSRTGSCAECRSESTPLLSHYRNIPHGRFAELSFSVSMLHTLYGGGSLSHHHRWSAREFFLYIHIISCSRVFRFHKCVSKTLSVLAKQTESVHVCTLCYICMLCFGVFEFVAYLVDMFSCDSDYICLSRSLGCCRLL